MTADLFFRAASAAGCTYALAAILGSLRHALLPLARPGFLGGTAAVPSIPSVPAAFAVNPRPAPALPVQEAGRGATPQIATLD